MNDEALRAAWLSIRTNRDTGTPHTSTADAVARAERVIDQKERRIRFLLAVSLILLCPLLLWASAHGRTPLVRGAYGLMGIGVAVLVFAEWLWLRWSRQERPGPADTRSQLLMSASVLARQADLLKTAFAWSAPAFIGALMIAYWIVREASALEGTALAVAVGLGWVAAAALSLARGREIDDRRSRVDAILLDLSSSDSQSTTQRG